MTPSRNRLPVALAAAALLLVFRPIAGHATNVTTYHYDNLRTGWDQTETILTPANVASSAFGLLRQVTLDEQVDAQPLFLAANAAAGDTHNIVYVATENNSIYGIDSDTGRVLLHRNLGTPVPMSALPGGCSNNSNHIGINSTPVIDLKSQTLYLISDTYENSTSVFRIHALDLKTLADKVPSVVISATAKLADGSTYAFSAGNERQRPGLIETSGAIYAGFGSFCDVNANRSRGWVLGWQAGSLAPLAANQLINEVPTSQSSFFLSSIWMSGYGIASDDEGSLFFVTGNSDASTYNTQTNLAESVVRLSADLTTTQSFFTPGNHARLDDIDDDFGAGGVLLLPDQTGGYPHLAVAAGKGDSMYLLNRDNLGGLAAHFPALRTFPNGGCWCGQSYFTGSDGVGRIVASTGQHVAVWKLVTQPSPNLLQESSGPTLASGQDPGFFTTISSNFTTANTAVIWALPHPQNSDSQHTIMLVAFDPANGSKQIAAAPAGTWPFAGNANANLVPVVGDGHVFVASYKQLSIFGLAAPAVHRAFAAAPAPVMVAYTGTRHQLTGTVISLTADTLTLRSRTGTLILANLAAARATSDVTELAPGHAALVRGDYDVTGTFLAQFVMHAKDAPQLWAADR
jgi:hypothetical protein